MMKILRHKAPFRPLHKAQILVLTLVLITALEVLIVAIFSNVTHFVKFGASSIGRQQAIHLAESGIDFAAKMVTLNTNYSGSAGEMQFGTTGTFEVTVTTNSVQKKTITATGYVPNKQTPKLTEKIQINLVPTDANSVDLLGYGTASFSALIQNDTLYVLGGQEDNCHLLPPNVQFSQINPSDFSLGTWQTTASLPQPRAKHSSVAANGYIYVIGGSYNCTTRSTVYYARPDPVTKQISSWQTTTSIPGAANGGRYSFFDPANSDIYVVGPISMYWSHQNPDGTLGAWTSIPYSIPSEQKDDAAFVFTGNYLYVLGGVSNYTYTRQVSYGALNGNHTVGPFVKMDDKLPINLSGSAAAVVGDYIYVLGGRNQYINEQGNFGEAFVSGVYYAKIQPNHSLGDFATSTNSLPQNRAWATALGISDSLFVLGGFTEPDHRSGGNTWVTTQNPFTGEIGPWTDNYAPITYSGWALDKSTYLFK